MSSALIAMEIMCTRLISVLFYYHFAFLVVSIALFGMTAGTLLVYVLPKRFSKLGLKALSARFGLMSAIMTGLTVPAFFLFPAILAFYHVQHIILPALSLIMILPFLFLGACLSSIIAGYEGKIGVVYAASLAGSAVGCFEISVLLNNLNAPSCIFLLAALCAVASSLMIFGRERLLTAACLVCGFFFLSLAGFNQATNFIYPTYAKGQIRDSRPILSVWNFFSYLTISPPPRIPFGWGFSPLVERTNVPTREVMLLIDEGAGTVVTQFSSLHDLDYLMLDVTSVVYAMRRNDKVLVIGSGGGRDMLAAAVSGASSITGVEVNKDINNVAFKKLKYFSGALQALPGVQFEVDDARSFLSRSQERYDVIQASLVDSFAAFSNGAFALTENGLYTTEAWTGFLERLNDSGVLTFSRWYDPQDPKEIYRMLSLAASSLHRLGILDAARNIILVSQISPGNQFGVGTILVSKSSFTSSDIEVLAQWCKDLEFDLLLSPDRQSDPAFRLILQAGKNPDVLKDSRIAAPSDNKPFFFFFGQFRDLFWGDKVEQGTFVLRSVLFSLVIFALILVAVPLLHAMITGCRPTVKVSGVFYFLFIGMGFMLVQVSLMQRLGIYLGHPVFGLTAVLSSLLLAAGAGSLFSGFADLRVSLKHALTAVLICIAIAAFGLPPILNLSTSFPVVWKVLIAVVFTALLGLFMGFLFPRAMNAVTSQGDKLLFLGINGFASVCGSAFAAILMLHFGYLLTLSLAFLFYALALIASIAGPVFLPTDDDPIEILHPSPKE